jgi:hypothetical protein
MTHPLLEALNALRQELPRAKTGFVKCFLPQIEEALAVGHSRRVVWERLQQQRSDLGYKEFCVYLGRLRRREGKRSGEARIERSTLITQPPRDAPVGHDPFANLRRVEAQPPVFHWRGSQDLEELVHGKKRGRKDGG